MKIQFISIGRQDEAYVAAGVKEFTGRIQKYFKAEWAIVPPPKNSASMNEPELKRK